MHLYLPNLALSAACFRSRLALEMYKGLREKKLVQANLDKVDGLKPIASDLGCSLAQLALAWCAHPPATQALPLCCSVCLVPCSRPAC